MRLTKEIVKDKINELWGKPFPEMEMIHQSDNEFIVLTVAESFEIGNREVCIYKVYVTHSNEIKTSEEFSFTVNINSDSSLAACIGDCMLEFGKIIKRNN